MRSTIQAFQGAAYAASDEALAREKSAAEFAAQMGTLRGGRLMKYVARREDRANLARLLPSRRAARQAYRGY